jgi:hypothetical protein
LIATEKDVPARSRHADAVGYTPKSFGFHSRPSSLGGAM